MLGRTIDCKRCVGVRLVAHQRVFGGKSDCRQRLLIVAELSDGACSQCPAHRAAACRAQRRIGRRRKRAIEHRAALQAVAVESDNCRVGPSVARPERRGRADRVLSHGLPIARINGNKRGGIRQGKRAAAGAGTARMPEPLILNQLGHRTRRSKSRQQRALRCPRILRKEAERSRDDAARSDESHATVGGHLSTERLGDERADRGDGQSKPCRAHTGACAE